MIRITSVGFALGLVLTAIALNGCGGDGGSTPAANTPIVNHPSPLSPAEFLYVGNTLDNTLSQYQIATDGTLTPLAPATVGTGKQPLLISADSRGRFLYVANAGDGAISQFAVGANGALTPLSPATVSGDSAGAGGSLGGMIFDSTGRFLYLINTATRSLRTYAVNADGTLTFKSAVTGISAPSFLAANPTLPVLYVGSDDNKTLSQFSVNSDGSLTPLSPATVPAPQNLTQLAVTPNGKFAYLNVSDSPTPAEYRVNADGTLAVLSLGTTNLSSKSFFVSIDPGSRFVYATGTGPTGAQFQQFKINADGTLTSLTPPAIQFGLTEGAIVTFEPSGQFAYVPNPLGNAVVAFHIASDGTFSDLPSPTVAAGNLPISGASIQRSALKRGAGGAGFPMALVRR